ncbi:MAG: DUF3011 domain-containing protein [Gammaproteobacteria bacterium]
MDTLKTIAVLAVVLAAGCADKTKEADRLNGEVKSEVCRIKETLPPMSATLAAAERDTAVVEAVVMLSEKVRKSPALIAKTREVKALVKDFKPSDRFTYFFDANRLDESTVRQIVEAQCPFEFIDDAVEAAAEAPAADALGEPAANGGGMDEAAMAAAEDAGIAAADAQFAAEAERERLLAEAEVARARKEILKAERELLEERRQAQQNAQMDEVEVARARKEAAQAERQLIAEQRRQAEQSAQMAVAAPKVSCPYNVANPLKCASRDRQPTACAWNFEACGMPRLFKQESKTTCTGKMSADQAAGQIIIVDGCRGLFVPQI